MIGIISIIIALIIVYMVWFVNGKPKINIDYLELFNEKALPKITEQQNGCAEYEKACRLYVKPGKEVECICRQDPMSLSRIDRLKKDIEDGGPDLFSWVKDNESAWVEFVKGSEKPYACRKYDYGEHVDRSKKENMWLLAIEFPGLSEKKNLACAGGWGALMDVQQGNIEQGLDKCVSIIKAGRHLRMAATLIEQLMGIRIEKIGCDLIIEIASKKQLSEKMLKELNENLANVYKDGYTKANYSCERLCFLDTIQHVYTQGGLGGGHIIPKRLKPLIEPKCVRSLSDPSPSVPRKIKWLDTRTGCIFRSLVMAGRKKMIDKSNEVFDHVEKLPDYSPYRRKTENIKSVDELLQEFGSGSFFIKNMMPAVEMVADLHYRGKANYESTLAVIAVLRHEKEMGTLPDSLERLVESGYLREIPMDPFTDGPLVYKRLNDGFTLYSVGLNFTDNGGEHGTNNRGRAKMWGVNGDAVFWPIQ